MRQSGRMQTTGKVAAAAVTAFLNFLIVHCLRVATSLWGRVEAARKDDREDTSRFSIFRFAILRFAICDYRLSTTDYRLSSLVSTHVCLAQYKQMTQIRQICTDFFSTAKDAIFNFQLFSYTELHKERTELHRDKLRTNSQ